MIGSIAGGIRNCTEATSSPRTGRSASLSAVDGSTAGTGELVGSATPNAGAGFRYRPSFILHPPFERHPLDQRARTVEERVLKPGDGRTARSSPCVKVRNAFLLFRHTQNNYDTYSTMKRMGSVTRHERAGFGDGIDLSKGRGRGCTDRCTATNPVADNGGVNAPDMAITKKTCLLGATVRRRLATSYSGYSPTSPEIDSTASVENETFVRAEVDETRPRTRPVTSRDWVRLAQRPGAGLDYRGVTVDAGAR